MSVISIKGIKMKNFYIFAGLFLIGQTVVYQIYETNSLKRENRLLQQQIGLLNDQIFEYSNTIGKLTYDKENADMKAFMSGVLSSNLKKEQVNQIWHDGYNSGSQATEYFYTTNIKEANNDTGTSK
jgi:hypothetical protein